MITDWIFWISMGFFWALILGLAILLVAEAKRFGRGEEDPYKDCRCGVGVWMPCCDDCEFAEHKESGGIVCAIFGTEMREGDFCSKHIDKRRESE